MSKKNKNSIPALLYHGVSLQRLVESLGQATLWGEVHSDGSGLWADKTYAAAHRPNGAVIVMDTALLRREGYRITPREGRFLIATNGNPVSPMRHFMWEIRMPVKAHARLMEMDDMDLFDGAFWTDGDAYMDALTRCREWSYRIMP